MARCADGPASGAGVGGGAGGVANLPTLIETVRIRSGLAPLWYLHLRRLAASCKALGVPLPGELITPEGGPDRVHRLEVGWRGLKLSERAVGPVEPVRLVLSRVTHPGYRHKTTARASFERAQAEAMAAGADDGILLTEGGYVGEAAIWSLFWWEDDRVCTPPLDLRILPGVARSRIAELAGIEERRVGPEALRGRSLFVANAVRGVVPVARLGQEDVPQVAATPRLAASFWP